MKYKNLLIDVDTDNILTLTVNRPKSLNAINDEVMNEIGRFFREDAPNRKEIVGVVITGAGEKSFMAGADIKEFLSMKPGAGDVKAQNGHDVFFAIERFPKPVIAAVNGFALGAGCELAMACHMRIAGEKARFGQPEVNLGIIPGYGGTQRLIQFIGKGKAMELLLTADMIKADEAHRLGLVNHVVPVGEEVTKSKEIIKKIATKGPVAIAKIVETVNAYFDKNTDGFNAEVQQFGELSATKDFVEGASAFVEKRAANFTGE